MGDIDIRTAFQVLHRDKRWFEAPAAMTSYVYPGCGFGGYCLPKDTLALVSQSIKNGYSPDILKSAIQVNEVIQQFVVREITEKVCPKETIGMLLF
ncbi:hypothetical protein [Paenibacillus sedimenti]|uniref:hypothetical protein n=1 Tax=Paenibacillus sedimenti TaxID=2770274 RepID=UPI0028A0E383|nr:hypothetical protein [Paenibacillus sedimenti]